MSEADREFQKAVMEGLVPKIKGATVSAVVISEHSPADSIDAKFCTELGVMIMLDKPILAIRMPGAAISKKLELVADVIVEADITTPEGQAILEKTVEDLHQRLGL